MSDPEQPSDIHPAPSLPQYVTAKNFIHPKQQKPLFKLLNRMLKPRAMKHAKLPKRTKKKHQVRFY